MANEEHLALLKQGVDHWNKWRHGNDSIEPDLTGAHLTGADLTRAHLSGAYLTGAHLSAANLSGADLRGAHLREAHLSGADLRGAYLISAHLRRAHLGAADLRGAILIEADLNGAHLSAADLTGTHLTGTHLTGANLRRAHLSGAIFYETTLGNTDLTNTMGLDSCRHDGPSTIDHRTIMRSWPLPLPFLRGCGLPDNLIAYLPSLLNEPLQFFSCFISYSSCDQEFSERLYADLQNKGVRCWYAPEDMKIGDEFRSRIDQAIHVHDRLLLILSEHLVASHWVQKEVETAFEKEGREKRLVLFPVRLDGAVIESTVGWAADVRRQRHIGDFTRWKDHDAYQKSFARLLRDLKPEAQEEQGKSPRKG